jgi:hypothetical protein
MNNCKLEIAQIYLLSQVVPKKQDYCTILRCGKTSIFEKLDMAIETISALGRASTVLAFSFLLHTFFSFDLFSFFIFYYFF